MLKFNGIPQQSVIARETINNFLEYNTRKDSKLIESSRSYVAVDSSAIAEMNYEGIVTQFLVDYEECTSDDDEDVARR